MTMPIQKVRSCQGDGEANEFLEEIGKTREWELHAIVGVPSGDECVPGFPTYIFVKRWKADAQARFT